MFRHNIILALRSFKRNRSSFFINLIGLSTGLTSVLLIYFWVNSELKIDKFHQFDNQLYQVMTNQFLDNEIQTWPSTPDQLAETLKDEVPDIELAASVMPAEEFGEFRLSYGNGQYTKAKGQFASPDFFKIFIRWRR